MPDLTEAQLNKLGTQEVKKKINDLTDG